MPFVDLYPIASKLGAHPQPEPEVCTNSFEISNYKYLWLCMEENNSEATEHGPTENGHKDTGRGRRHVDLDHSG